jgi:5-(carboxyamino)imidazole ribonucleotide synthase
VKVGILGTGQLSLMMAQANKDLGVTFVPYGKKGCKGLDDFCTPVYASMEDSQALDNFLSEMDVITFDSESVQTEKLENPAFTGKFAPTLEALKIFQHRIKEKNFFVEQGLLTTKFRAISNDNDIADAAEHVGFPSVLKTVRDGYDGRGQMVVKSLEDLNAGFQELSTQCILEEFIDFETEVSIIAARDRQGSIACYPLTENFHRDGQLRLSIVAEKHPLQAVAEKAISALMNKLDYVGLMAIEFFVKGDQLIVNEVAPRVHNSGHWTIDGADSSQFLQHLKAVAGITVTTPAVTMPIAMINCIGELPDFKQFADNANISCLGYGKKPRPERKVGHINVSGANCSRADFYQQVQAILLVVGEEALAEVVAKRV